MFCKAPGLDELIVDPGEKPEFCPLPILVTRETA